MNNNNTFAEYKKRKQREGKLPIHKAELSPEEATKKRYEEYKQQKRRENEEQDCI